MCLISENDVDGKALAMMLKESDQIALKELVPKVGPRIKIKNIFGSMLGNSSMNNKTMIKNSLDTLNTNAQLQGQQKLKLTADGWAFGKFLEGVRIFTLYIILKVGKGRRR